MAIPVIGCDYRLDIPQHILDEDIPWVNQRSKHIAKIWREIEGEICTVKGKTRLLSIYCIAAMRSFPKDSFYVPEKRLMELTRRLPIPCICDIRILMARGCICGTFRKEKNNI